MRALLPAIRTLAQQQSRPGRSWPAFREAASFSRTLYQLLGRGWSAADAAETAWRRAYGSQNEAAATSTRSFPNVAGCFGSLFHPLLWPQQLSVQELVDATQLTVLRREATLLEASFAASISAASSRACSVQPVQTLCDLGAWVRAFPAAAALLPETHLLACIGTCGDSPSVYAPQGASSIFKNAPAVLQSAAIQFLESCSPFDAELRALLLHSLSERLAPPHDASWAEPFCALRAYAVAASELASHPAVALVHSARLRAASVRGRRLVQSLPFDLDAGVTVAEECSVQQQDSPPQDELAASCAALISSEAIMSATCRMLLSAAYIAAQQAEAERRVDTNLHLALLRAADPNERVRRAPAHASTDALPHVFTAVAALEAAVIGVGCTLITDAFSAPTPEQLGSASLAAARLLKPLDRLAEWRSRCVAILGDADCTAPPPVETIVLAWLRMRKSLCKVVELLDSTPANDAVASAATVAAGAMDACCGISDLGAPKPLLWRFAGHPSLPTDRTMHEVEGELRVLAELPTLAHDPGLRAALAQAVCFFSWSHVGAEHDAPKLSLSEASAMHALAVAKVRSAELMPELGVDAVDCAPLPAEINAAAAASCDASDAINAAAAETVPWTLTRWRAAAEAANELRAFAAFASFTASLPVLASLTAAAFSDSVVLDGAALVPASTMTALLRYGISATGRSPLDFAPLQQVVWLSERLQEDADAAAQLKRVLPAASHELWFRFHAAAWTAPSPGRDGPLWAISAGTAPLFRPAAIMSLFTITSASTKVTVVERPVVLLKLRLAARCLRRGAQLSALPGGGSEQLSASADRRAVHTLTVQLLLAYADSLPPLGKVAALLSLCDGAAAAASELDSASATLPTLFSSMFAPLIAALASRHQPGSPDDEASRGAAWSRLGCARLALLAAELVADPAARDAFKLGHVRSRRLQEFEPEAQLRAAAAAMPGARSFERGLHKCQTALAHADVVVDKLVARAVQRPRDSSWLPARAEIERFVNGLGCVSPLPRHLTRRHCTPIYATQGRYVGREFILDTNQTSYSFGALYRWAALAAQLRRLTTHTLMGNLHLTFDDFDTSDAFPSAFAAFKSLLCASWLCTHCFSPQVTRPCVFAARRDHTWSNRRDCRSCDLARCLFALACQYAVPICCISRRHAAPDACGV